MVLGTTIGDRPEVSAATGSEPPGLDGWSEAIWEVASGLKRGAEAWSAVMGSLPGEHALAPGVPETDQEDRDEQQHADETAKEQVLEDHRPEEDEDDLDVEGDEQQRIDVEREAEAAPRVAERVDARLVRQPLVAVALVAMAQQPGHQDR